MNKRKLIAFSLLALFLAGPAAADNNRQLVCASYLSLASTNDDTVLAIAPPGGAKVLAIGCGGDADITTPGAISFEDSAGNAVTASTLVCAENGANLTWAPATAGNTFLAGEGIVFDIDNGMTTAAITVCAYIETRD